MTCGKKPYKSKHEARFSCRHMHESVRVYLCDEGHPGMWHTTQERYSSKNHQLARAWQAKKRQNKKRNR